jgi:hypothetical protein
VSYRIAFCGPSCQLSWILEQNDYDSRLRILALKCFAIKVMGVRTEYAPAAPRSALKCFSPEHGMFHNHRDFRNANRVAVHIEREFPLVPHSIVWEERVIRRERGGNALPGEIISGETPVGCFRNDDFTSPAMKPFPIRGRQLPKRPRTPPREVPRKPSEEEPLFQRFVSDASACSETEAGLGVKQDAARSEQQSQKRRKPAVSKSRKKEVPAKTDERPSPDTETHSTETV